MASEAVGARATDTLTATVSFRLTEDEGRTLALRADGQQRAVSQLIRLLLREALQPCNVPQLGRADEAHHAARS